MKRNLAFALAGVLAIGIAGNSVFASEEPLATVPMKMQPGTVIIYDEDCSPTFLSGGYTASSFSNKPLSINIEDRLANIPEDATPEEKEKLERENELVRQLYEKIEAGMIEVDEPSEIVPGMKVVYDIYGEINNIYYIDDAEPSGYSIHGMEGTLPAIAKERKTPPVWGTHNNSLIYQKQDDSFLGTGRATYFTDTTGNRDNKLGPYDCATHMTYDASTKGDQPVAVRNLDTDEAYTYYQADVGRLDDAVIDIWGLDYIHELAGNNKAISAPNVRMYHKRFSDQSIPDWD